MPMTGAVKDFVGHSVFASGLPQCPAAQRRRRRRVPSHPRRRGIRLAFHRRRDVRTVLAGFFDSTSASVGLPELALKLERRERLHRELAITFDDGYLDNYENAAPVLEVASCPRRSSSSPNGWAPPWCPWWDRGPRRVPEVDDVGSRAPLHRRGFDIGGHTQTHADLGTVSGDVALREILGARAELLIR